ncbi:MAG: hypothetical protein K8H75_15705 [Sulfuricella sp.]|nr:hypothetical protein [Sulfuricella sp.]
MPDNQPIFTSFGAIDMAGIAKKAGMSPIRKKQMFLLSALVIVVIGIAFVASMLGAPKKAPPARVKESTRKAFGAQGEKVNNADLWRTQEGARVTVLQQQLADMQNKMTSFEKRDKDEKKRSEEDAARKAEEEKRFREELTRQKAAPPAAALPGPPLQSNQLGTPPGTGNMGPGQGEVIKGIMRVDMGAGGAQPGAQKAAYAQPRNDTATGNKDGSGPDVKGGQTAETYIPAGAFMRGVLLSGLDAPTGGQAQQNPHPIVIEVLDMASLPNKFRADYKNCRVTANGVGDLSSERAYIRLDRLSCINEEGGAIDVAVKGYIADSTGKAGVRGRLVSKQGQVLANALLSGVASGIGQAFTQGSMNTSVSPLGATQTVQAGKEMQAGIGQGVGNALSQLSRYYITLADKMFPIIEIDAGQPVDIVITRGVSVARK